MGEQHSRFESLVMSVRSAELKKMAQRWGGSYQSRKEECLALILAGLRDPKRVREVVTRLPDLDRTALGLVRLAGGHIEAKALTAGLRASGVALPKGRNSYDRNDNMLARRLIEAGMILSTYADNPTYVGEYGGAILVSDERLLAKVEPPPYVPLTITQTAPPPIVLARRPAAVGMELSAVLRAIEALGGLLLTKAGDVRAGDLRKFNRAMKWPEDVLIIDGLRFPRPVVALTTAIAAGGMLQRQFDRLAVGDHHSLTSRPYAEQVGDLLRGFLHLYKWQEDGEAEDYSTYDLRYPAMRMALIVALAALPDTPGAFFAIDDLSAALFERVGEHVSLGYGPHPLYVFNKTPAEVRKAEEDWRAKLHADWLTRERPWIERALTSWLFFLGLVEIGMAHDVPVSVRLSDLGRTLLRGASDREALSPRPSSTAWVVQPDFEVVVYLDHATPVQVAFVERHAERVQAESHVARYRLTRDSVHRGLEGGTSPEQLIEILRDGMSAAVPQNVQATLREWAAQRERITLRQRASLLEFPDGTLRDRALQGAIAGTPLGERFVLVSGTRLELPHVQLDYARPLPRCLTVTEEGLLKLTKPTPDLLIQSQLDRWAERVDDKTWRLTAGSVVAAIRAGGAIDILLALLRERLSRPLPALLEVALRAWAGKAPAVALATVTALRCPQPEVFRAITGSQLLAPYLRGALAPDVLLVDSERLAALRERLAWAGLSVSETLDMT
jgi:hypothetical protein